MSVRTRRVAGEIQKVLGEVIARDHSDVSNGLVTVTDVDISPDLRNAKVFVSILGGTVPHEKVIRELNERAPALRTAVSKRVYLRNAPHLLFIIDETGERVERISRLISEWHDESRDKPEAK